MYTTIDETHQPSSYPHGRHVGIGFEMLVLSLRYWHWMTIVRQVRIPMFDVLTLGPKLDMLTLRSRREFQDVEVGFKTSPLVSRCWCWV